MERADRVARPGARLGGRYALGELLGRGGSAAVYAAQDTRLARPVAIKVLHADLAADPDLVASFQQEARAAAALNHPGIVAVHDVGGGGEGPDAEPPWIVLERVDGITLTDALPAGSDRPLRPDQAIEVVVQVLGALEHAHRNGVVHRDISPANIMLTNDGTVKVMDFGIAAATGFGADVVKATPDRSGTMRGTARYIAPEQASGRDVDARADVYATGCVLFALLTGRPPFADGAPAHIVAQHVHVPPPLASSLHAGLPVEVDAVLARALRKAPGDRYADARAMRAALVDVATRLGSSSGAPAERLSLAGVVARQPAGADETTLLPVFEDCTSLLPLVPVGTRAQVPVPAVGVQARTDATAPASLPLTPSTAVGEASWGRAVLLSVAMVAVIVAMLAFLLQREVPPSAASTTGVAVVPALAGSSIERAMDVLSASGFHVAEETRRRDDSVPAGLVIGSQPEAGSRVPTGASVTLLVSSGPGEVQVPPLEGLGLAEARRALERFDLRLGDLTRQESNRPADTVVAAAPAIGTVVRPGTAVTLVLASGLNVVPDVAHQNLRDARALIENAGFAVDPRVQEADGAVPGTVLFLSPTAGSVLRLGSRVTAVVAGEPRIPQASPTVPPDPSGTSPTQAPTAGATPSPTSTADPTQSPPGRPTPP